MRRWLEALPKVLTPLTFFGALTAFSSAVARDRLTTRQLLAFCTSPDDQTAIVACRLYVLGVVEGSATADGAVIRGNQLLPGKKSIVCVPEGVASEQLSSDYVQGMISLSQKYPDDLNLPAVHTVVGFIMERYPCR